MTESREGEAATTPWTIADAVIGFILGIVAATVVVGIWIGFTDADAESLGSTTSQLIGLWGGLIGWMAFISRRKGSGDLRRDFGLRFEWPGDLRGIPLGVAAQFGLALLVYVPLSFLVDDLSEYNDPVESLDKQAGSDLGFVLLAVLLVVGAPIVEELFYRGLLFTAVSNRVSPGPAVALTGALFALAHIELLLFPALALFGVLLCVLVRRTGRLGLAITTHAGFNAVVVLGLIIDRWG